MQKEDSSSDELKVDRQEANEIKDAMTLLLRSPGWIKLREVLEKQVEMHKVAFFTAPLEDSNKVFAQEFTKGVANGLLIAIRFPQLLLASAEETLASIPGEDDDA